MQHLENDMDDMFQRAAEDYPLKANADWESVAGKMEAAGNPGKALTPAKDKKDKKIILLFLLLFLLGGALFTWHSFSSNNPLAEKNIELTKETQASQGGANSQHNVATALDEKQTADISSVKNKNKKKKAIISSQTKVIMSAGNSSFVSNNTIDNTVLKTNGAKEFNNNNAGVSDSGNLEKPTSNNSPEKNENSKEIISSQPLKENDKLNQEEGKKPGADTTTSNKKPAAKANKKNKGLYVGLITGLDFSKVASGSFGNTGFDAGFIVGYKFRSKLSIETGLLVNNKNYNSAGKDFNMDKIGSTMPSGMVIDNINSHSSLLEIPIKVKYDLIQKATSNFFIAGGASAYIMTKEKNMYDATVNGTQEKIMGIYKRNNYGLPAVANISIGYEHKISGLLNVRVEPFLKIPLQGMGVGSLSVTSAGLQVGITGRLR